MPRTKEKPDVEELAEDLTEFRSLANPNGKTMMLCRGCKREFSSILRGMVRVGTCKGTCAGCNRVRKAF